MHPESALVYNKAAMSRAGIQLLSLLLGVGGVLILIPASRFGGALLIAHSMVTIGCFIATRDWKGGALEAWVFRLPKLHGLGGLPPVGPRRRQDPALFARLTVEPRQISLSESLPWLAHPRGQRRTEIFLQGATMSFVAECSAVHARRRKRLFWNTDALKDAPRSIELVSNALEWRSSSQRFLRAEGSGTTSRRHCHGGDGRAKRSSSRSSSRTQMRPCRARSFTPW